MPNASGRISPARADSESGSQPDAPNGGAAGLTARFAAALTALRPLGKLALAVSGGGDSMALVHLCLDAAGKTGAGSGNLHLFTVDHGLRPDSGAEAARVARWAAALGVDHATLTWPGRERGRRGTGFQAAARQARYCLLIRACAETGASCLLTAHTADDQAETVALRLARGSGVDGLAAMVPEQAIADGAGREVRLLRPLLGETRAGLRTWMRARGAEWIDDPGNEDMAFERVRVRQALALLAPLGIGRAELCRTAARMAQAREALDAAAAALTAACGALDPAGYATVDPAGLTGAPREVAVRALAGLMRRVSGRPHRPPSDRLDQLRGVLADGDLGKGRTLGGCRILPLREKVLICREARGLPPPMALTPGGPHIWDNRFAVRLAAGAAPGRVAPLGAEGVALARAALGGDIAPLPAAARVSLPGLWRGETLVAAPHLGLGDPGFEARFVNGVPVLPVRFLDLEPADRP